MAAGVNDIAVTPVIFFDALGDIMRVGDEIIHAVRGALVPDAHFVHLAGHDELRQPVGVGAVGVVKIPHITDRRVAVADVYGIRAGDDAFGTGGGRRQHQIVLGQVERLKRAGHQRQHGLIQPVGEGHLLEPARADVIAFKVLGHVFGVVHKGVDDGIGENTLHGVHNAVPAGVADKPVVNDGDLGLLFAHYRHSRPVTHRALL